jgi:hypothetical protein
MVGRDNQSMDVLSLRLRSLSCHGLGKDPSLHPKHQGTRGNKSGLGPRTEGAKFVGQMMETYISRPQD